MLAVDSCAAYVAQYSYCLLGGRGSRRVNDNTYEFP
jgi:hypothetical protein